MWTAIEKKGWRKRRGSWEKSEELKRSMRWFREKERLFTGCTTCVSGTRVSWRKRGKR